MSDESAVFAHCRQATGLISDGAARTIAAWWYDGPLGEWFVTTGGVHPWVWGELTNLGAIVGQVNDDHRLALEKLHEYLHMHLGRGPVTGWSQVWVR